MGNRAGGGAQTSVALHTCAFTPQVVGTSGGPDSCDSLRDVVARARSSPAAPNLSLPQACGTCGTRVCSLMSARVSAKPGELVAPNPECPRRPSQIEKEVETSTSFRRRSVVQTASERLSGAGVAWATSDRKAPLRSRRRRQISFQSRRSLSQNHVIRSTKLQRVVTSRVVDDFTQRSRRLRRVHLIASTSGESPARSSPSRSSASSTPSPRRGAPRRPVRRHHRSAARRQPGHPRLGARAPLRVLPRFPAIHLFCSHDPADLLAGSSSTSRCSPSVSSARRRGRSRQPVRLRAALRVQAEDETAHRLRMMGRVSERAHSTPATHLAPTAAGTAPSPSSASSPSRDGRSPSRCSRIPYCSRGSTASRCARRSAQVLISEAAGARPVCLLCHVLVVLFVLASRATALPPAAALPGASECM